MKHLLYATFYIFTLADYGCKTVFIFLIFLILLLALRHISNPSPSTPIQAQTCCVVTTPSGGLVQDASQPESQANGSLPRRQRSLRERAGIDGRLGNLNHSNTILPNTSTYLAPSPSVTDSTNAEFSRPVKKADFAEHVRFMTQDSDQRFVEEYQDLSKVGKGQPCTVADMPCNRSKNRFANVLPYDHSRVTLNLVDGVEGSDYINASYIPGYNGHREFICTQGPLASTKNDFWRMVWEERSEAIVNLTRCLEKGREKCDQYWPNDHEPLQFGPIHVSLVSETKYPFGTIREFQLTCDDQIRCVHHFHFTAWPDFGVPEKPQKLVKFIRSFRAHIPPTPNLAQKGPVIVHCSAGVGRSGTMIAIDRILQHMETHDYVDVYGIVYEMRKERYWMVQTEQQYIFIHHCLLCVLEGRENDEDLSPTILNSNTSSPMTEISPFVP